MFASSGGIGPLRASTIFSLFGKMEEREYFLGEREEKIGIQLQGGAALERNTYFAAIQGAFAKLQCMA